MTRTRIKICGITREQDLDSAVAAGTDALGFVFYGPSPRYVIPEQAARLVARVPAFVKTVGLFVNAPAAEVSAVLDRVPLDILQFHGDETPCLLRGILPAVDQGRASEARYRFARIRCWICRRPRDCGTAAGCSCRRLRRRRSGLRLVPDSTVPALAGDPFRRPASRQRERGHTQGSALGSRCQQRG